MFFSTLEHAGFVSAISHSLLVELATTPVLLALVSMLPARAREDEVVEAAAAGPTAADSLVAATRA